MTAPTVHPHTRRVYDSLPDVYRDVDLDDGSADGQPLLRFLSLILDQVGGIEDLIDRIDPDRPGGSDLLNAEAADAGWLPWLAQLFGVTLPPSLTVAEQRNAVSGAVSGWRAGTRETIAAAAKTALSDPSGYVSIRAHNGGDWRVIGVSVDPEFAPANLDDVVAAIIAARAKPAGIKLVIDLYAATWDTLEAVYLSWDAVDAVATWSRLEGTDPPA